MTNSQKGENMAKVVYVSIGLLRDNNALDYPNELLEDIWENGLKTPLTVTANKDGTYTVLDGCHRYRCCKKLGFSKVPCIVVV